MRKSTAIAKKKVFTLLRKPQYIPIYSQRTAICQYSLTIERETALRARLNARALTAPRTLPTPASHLSHHAERISIASVKGVNRAILDRRAKLASELSRRALGP